MWKVSVGKVREGENPVWNWKSAAYECLSTSRVAWDCSLKLGGKFHLKLNTCDRPIAHKYRKGKVKRTLKRESKVLETAERQGIRTVGSSRHHWLSWLPKLLRSLELKLFVGLPIRVVFRVWCAACCVPALLSNRSSPCACIRWFDRSFLASRRLVLKVWAREVVRMDL